MKEKYLIQLENSMQMLYEQISTEALSMGADKVVLYGSRARGDQRENSDIDLAVWGLGEAAQLRFIDMIDELPTLLDFDVVFISDNTDPALLANIEKDGIVIMNKFAEKYEKLEKAVARLQEAVEAYAATPGSVVRDGVIQRFEFCTELTWKTLREHLIDQGYSDINSPKAVMKQAYADGILGNESVWLALLNDRNLTAHLYDDATAQEIFVRIQGSYVDLFKSLLDRLKE